MLSPLGNDRFPVPMRISGSMVYHTDGNQVVFHPLALLIWVVCGGLCLVQQPHKSKVVK